MPITVEGYAELESQRTFIGHTVGPDKGSVRISDKISLQYAGDHRGTVLVAEINPAVPSERRILGHGNLAKPGEEIYVDIPLGKLKERELAMRLCVKRY